MAILVEAAYAFASTSQSRNDVFLDGATADAGDLLLAFIGGHGGNTFTAPPGFTTLGTANTSSSQFDAKLTCYYKFADGGETSIPLGSNGTQDKAYISALIKGVESVGNFAVNTGNSANSQTWDTPTLTTVAPGEVVFHAMCGIQQSSLPAVLGSFPGVTIIKDALNKDTRGVVFAYEEVLSPGVTTAKTYTRTGSYGYDWAGFSVAFAPTAFTPPPLPDQAWG